jgi:very-short-patch-repair endonuclease
MRALPHTHFHLNITKMDKSPKTLARARKLRDSETEAEGRLWGSLRDRRLAGFKFRRQVPVPPYIVDFLCVSQSLVVEVDGATHGDAHEIRYDEKRTAYLESKGLRVHRVLNHDVFTALPEVLDGILIALRERSAH